MLPPLPDSPLSSASRSSARSVHSSCSLRPSASASMSPSTSHYHSPIGTPSRSRENNLSTGSGDGSAIRLDTTTDEELEEDSSDDVEIYLSSLGMAGDTSHTSGISLSLNSSLSHSQAQPRASFVVQQQSSNISFSQQHQQQLPVADNSPILPLQTHSTPSPQLSKQEQGQANLSSPQLPPAPSQPTIPLPPISSPDSTSSPASRQYSQSTQTKSTFDSKPYYEFFPKSTQHQNLSQSQEKQNQPTYLASNPSNSPSNDDDNAFDLTDASNHHLGSIQSDPALESSGKTPNVYINGLPPHFPEDQLFALASPFGPVRSVRTFTRHVRDCESGYGFVLFETIEAAEKCIQSLRRYRNLHPTFSKQVHKIPGATTIAPPLNLPLTIGGTDTGSGSIQLEPPLASFGVWDQGDHQLSSDHLSSNGGGWVGDESVNGGYGAQTTASFKAKMESLHDKTSTNLYMEGLPLTIDEPTLSALVSPHRISSSRFFQTRLSNPPRIIAFVRFETRAGAEEIIERLHGRMVRGWNDIGSRISVRFADTAEQRELRRQERMVREGEESPARLTIAQASLLNLHGPGLRSVPDSNLSVNSPSVGMGITKLPPAPPLPIRLGMSPQYRGGDYAGDMDEYRPSGHLAHHHPNYQHAHPHAGMHTPPFQVDYSLAPSVSGRHGAVTGSKDQLVNNVGGPYTHSRVHTPIGMYGGRQGQQMRMDPAMAGLLESLHLQQQHGHGPAYTGYQQEYEHETSMHLPTAHYHQSPVFASNRHMVGGEVEYGPGSVGVDVGDVVTHANGYGNMRSSSRHLQQQYLDRELVSTHGSTQVRSQPGFTATEEFIMRAHAEGVAHQQQQHLHQAQQRLSRRPAPPPLDLPQVGTTSRRRRDSEASVTLGSGESTVGFGVGTRAFRAPAAQVFSPSLLGEGEFHAHAVAGQSGGTKHTHNHRIHPPHVNARLGALENRKSLSQQNDGGSASAVQTNYQHAHLRSSTLPHRAAPAAVSTGRHQQHNSMSVAASAQQQHHQQSSFSGVDRAIGNMNNNSNYNMNSNSNNGTDNNKNEINNNNDDSIESNDYDGTIASNSAFSGKTNPTNSNSLVPHPRRHNHRHDNNSNNDNGNNGSSGQKGDSGLGGLFEKSNGQAARYQHPNSKHNRNHSFSQVYHHNHSYSQVKSHHNQPRLQPQIHGLLTASNSDSQLGLYDSNVDSSPELISPALTYESSQQSHTPSTLSPATPFFSTMESGVGVGMRQVHQTGPIQEKSAFQERGGGNGEGGGDGQIRAGSR